MAQHDYASTADADPCSVDLEIWENWLDDDSARFGIVYPNRIRINGVEISTPAGVPFKISDVSSKEPLTATITFFVRSLTIHGKRNG